MDFINETGACAGWNIGFQPDGREVAIVVIKATYDMPADSRTPITPRSSEQVPLVEADEYAGEPGLSAPLVETDYSVFKPYCDVLLLGSAYTPGGRPAERAAVRMQVGASNKTIAVSGNRQWRRGGMGLRGGTPGLFNVLPISYDNAFGGIDRTNEAKGKSDTFVQNPVGQGYYKNTKAALGQPLPNTEELRNPVHSPDGNYLPMAFGPIGRSWFPRHKFAGTYDERWTKERAPILPTDFDSRYFQCAPVDQQISYPDGSERVILQNLTHDGYVEFSLPSDTMPVIFLLHRGEDVETNANIDTIVLEPDRRRFSMTWRACLPLQRDCFDIRQTIAGKMSRAWYSKRRAAKRGKTYYPSLSALVQAKRGRR